MKAGHYLGGTVLFLILVFSVSAKAAGTTQNVSTFGAKGDGITDDSAAILAAIAKAGHGGTVSFPDGSYVVTQPLVLNGVHLEGRSAGGFPADDDVMPRILIRQDKEPAVRCENSSSIHGLCFSYENGGDKPIQYPPTVFLSGNGISISNVKISNAYDAIMADGQTNIGRINLENIFLPEVLHTGVYLTKAYDIPTIRNVEVFCTNSFFLNNGVGFRFGRLDELHATDNFVIGAKIGFLFEDDKSEGGGSTYGGLVDCSTDGCQWGWQINGADLLRISGGSVLSHHFGIVIDHPGANVQIGTSMLQANSAEVLLVKNCESVNVTGTRFLRATDNPDKPMVVLEGGGNVILDNNTFSSQSPGVHLGKAIHDVVIIGNQFGPSKFPHITDETSPTTPKIVKDNL